MPYASDGKERNYLPDYLVRIVTPKLRRAQLILEITGFNTDKEIKRWYVRERWLPAVNSVREKLGLPPWYFEEVTDIDNIKPALETAIARIVAEVDAAPDTLREAFELLANLPDDFFAEGRNDPPALPIDPLIPTSTTRGPIASARTSASDSRKAAPATRIVSLCRSSRYCTTNRKKTGLESITSTEIGAIGFSFQDNAKRASRCDVCDTSYGSERGAGSRAYEYRILGGEST